MHESVTYMAILDEGEVKHARRIVLRVGQKKFGPPGSDVVAAVNGIENLERLDRLNEGVLDVSSWQELLRLP